MKLILLVEDFEDVARTVEDGLQRSDDYRIHYVPTAEEALAETSARRYDLLIVDWKLPEMSGVELVRTLRDRDYAAPVLMLTVRDSVENRVEALESGADDYLTKPFSLDELRARVRALLRRPSEWTPLDESSVGPLQINAATRTAEIHGRPIDLRKKEFDLLYLLADRAPQVVSRTVIAERVWGSDFVSDNAIDVTVSGLRDQIDSVREKAESIRVVTVRGVGYRLQTGEDS